MLAEYWDMWERLRAAGVTPTAEATASEAIPMPTSVSAAATTG